MATSSICVPIFARSLASLLCVGFLGIVSLVDVLCMDQIYSQIRSMVIPLQARVTIQIVPWVLLKKLCFSKKSND